MGREAEDVNVAVHTVGLGLWGMYCRNHRRLSPAVRFQGLPRTPGKYGAGEGRESWSEREQKGSQRLTPQFSFITKKTLGQYMIEN